MAAVQVAPPAGGEGDLAQAAILFPRFSGSSHPEHGQRPTRVGRGRDPLHPSDRRLFLIRAPRPARMSSEPARHDLFVSFVPGISVIAAKAIHARSGAGGCSTKPAVSTVSGAGPRSETRSVSVTAARIQTSTVVAGISKLNAFRGAHLREQ
jgi:hypothetical protein